MKKVFKIIVAFIVFCTTITPFINVSAVDTVVRFTTTYYHTAIELTGEFKNEVTGESANYSSDIAEQDGNYNDSTVEADINSVKTNFTNWANDKNAATINFTEGIDSYYYDAHDEIGEITAENYDNIRARVDNCEIGDYYINTVLDKHQTYVINATASNKEIPMITVDLEAPIAGETVNVMPWSGGICTDPEGCWEQDITPIVTTNDHITIDNTAWVEGTYTEIGEGFDDFFEGTIEPQTYYYAMISVSAEEGYSLSNNLNIRIRQTFNGGTITVAPAEVFAVQNHNNTFFIAKIKSVTHYIVDFETNGGSNISSQTLTGSGTTNSATVTKPTNPTKPGFNFAGWFTDEELTNEFDFNVGITDNLTLYAKWTEAPIEEETEDTNEINSPNTGTYTTTNSATSVIGLGASIIITFSLIIYFIYHKKPTE